VAIIHRTPHLLFSAMGLGVVGAVLFALAYLAI